MHKKTKANSGFTLIELLMVLGIMVFMLKLILPALNGLMGGKSHLIARSQLTAELNSARSAALRNGLPVYIVFLPTKSEILQLSGEVDNGQGQVGQYLSSEANSLLGGQSISYAMFAEYLPGDQPSRPSRVWLTDWRQLPEGFYFSNKELSSIWETASASGSRKLAFANLSNGHSKGSLGRERRIRLPYLMFNGRGELSARGNPTETRVGDFYFSITEGGVFQPPKNSDGGYTYVNAERPDMETEANALKAWIRINGITGRSDVLDQEPFKAQKYEITIHTFSIGANAQEGAEQIINELGVMGVQVGTDQWKRLEYWGARNSSGKWIWTGGLNRIKRPVAATGLSREELMKVISRMQRIDPRIEIKYKQVF